MWWFWMWLAFIVLVFLLPLGYGWGYRGWAAPYPSYYGRRRATREEARAAAEAETGWGILADVLWIVAVIALVWLAVAILV